MSWGCCNKLPQCLWLKTTEIYRQNCGGCPQGRAPSAGSWDELLPLPTLAVSLSVVSVLLSWAWRWITPVSATLDVLLEGQAHSIQGPPRSRVISLSVFTLITSAKALLLRVTFWGSEWTPFFGRWEGLDSITDSMDMNLSKPCETVEDRGARRAAVLGSQSTHLLTERQQWTLFSPLHLTRLSSFPSQMPFLPSSNQNSFYFLNLIFLEYGCFTMLC